ncbi:cysteine desulfurase family protein [Aquabacter spiritensis]|uniref:Cysteine desulfurase n=1 Tax=Aquabacter spiritensis TaxID=933073 RepID=A0A4V2UXE6_9HYPH|nr:cysteine desulfurase family protein [Aquabacter spiritensis]TCT03218.1 cysteine desulfurase [Aquabacter spiritensis]
MNGAALDRPARRVFLDHNATTPLRPAARAAMLDVLAASGNASSVHADGRAARGVVEAARTAVARLVGAPSAAIVFTSGATEANALVLHPDLEIAGQNQACDVLVTSAVEHPSVLRGHRFPIAQVESIPVDADGRLVLDALEQVLAGHAAAGRRALVSLMLANNETGVIQPVTAASALAHAHGAVMHCDAVQAPGRMSLDMATLGVDFLTISSHKIGGPQGAGALVAAHPHSRPRVPLIAGGGQERGLRAGTENVAAIAGFGAAAVICAAQGGEEAGRLRGLRDRLEKEIVERFQGSQVAGAGVERLPNTTSVIFAGLKAETLVIALDLAHVSVSAGSACSSGKVGPSHVLAAMGVGDAAAGGAIRLSLGWSSCDEDVDVAIAALGRVVPRLLNRPVRAA